MYIGAHIKAYSTHSLAQAIMGMTVYCESGLVNSDNESMYLDVAVAQNVYKF